MANWINENNLTFYVKSSINVYKLIIKSLNHLTIVNEKPGFEKT